MTRSHVIVDINSTFHLPTKHDQKSHGNRAGKKDNVPGKTSKYAPIVEQISEENARAPRMSDAQLEESRTYYQKNFKKAQKNKKVFDSLTTQGGLIHVSMTYDKQRGADDPNRHEIIKSVEDYKGPLYARLNNELRAGDVSPEMKQHVENIDHFMDVNATTKDVIVYRGLNPETTFGGAWDPEADNSGLEWIDDGFVSTSADHTVAQSFSRRRGDLTGVIMTMVVKAGTPAIPVDGLNPGKRGTEQELLLGRRLRYRVIYDSKRETGGPDAHNITVEVSPA